MFLKNKFQFLLQICSLNYDNLQLWVYVLVWRVLFPVSWMLYCTVLFSKKQLDFITLIFKLNKFYTLVYIHTYVIHAWFVDSVSDKLYIHLSSLYADVDILSFNNYVNFVFLVTTTSIQHIHSYPNPKLCLTAQCFIIRIRRFPNLIWDQISTPSQFVLSSQHFNLLHIHESNERPSFSLVLISTKSTFVHRIVSYVDISSHTKVW